MLGAEERSKATPSFDASTLPFGRELKAERLSIDPAQGHELVEWQNLSL